jgi:hypothetical protein
MSNSVAVQQKRFIRLAPSNNSSTGYGPVGSQPIIRFSVADTQALALLKDARLNAKVNVTVGGATPTIGQDINIDNCLGFCSAIDQVIVSSRRFGTQIEQVTQIGRLESSYYRSKYSPKMMASNVFHSSRAIGMGRTNRWEGLGVNKTTTSDPGLQATRRSIIAEKSVSLPFHIGLFLTDEPVDLSTVGGLELAIYLQKPEAMFFGSAATSMNYTLTDVSLTVPLIYKSSAMISQTPPESVVEFLNWTSLFSVLDSSVSSIAYRLYLSGLVAGIHNSLPTAQINSYANNQFALKSIGTERLTFLRDGQRAPLEKTMIVEDSASAIVTDKSTTFPEVLTEYLSAWGPVRDTRYSQVIPQNVKGIVNRSGVMGLGCNYSPNGAGINVSGVLSLDVQSKLEDETGSAPSQIEPYALYSFFLSRQAFVASPAGLKAM